MRFSPDFIDKVRDANDIVEIIGQHTELKGSGFRFMGRCPFPDHSDKSPSFSVSGDNQFFHCFGCKKGGNVFNFLELYNGLSFPEAVEFLARRASIPLPEKPAAFAKREGTLDRDQKELLLRVNKAAGIFFHQQLKALSFDHAAKQYLVKRGLSDETVEKFRIGVALDEWQGLVDHLRARKAPLDLAERLGLIKAKRGAAKPEDGYFDLFRDRLMFPIFSTTSDVIGFGGRALGEALPKYVNSSDSPIFNKSRVLYGIHETGKFIRAQDSAIVVEGYMDAIALYTAGIKNVVAILGTAFTADHAKILKRFTLNVTMLLDGDEAGLNGAERSLPILLEAGLMPKGFALPDKMDPDDYVKANGADKLREDVERAPELFNLLLMKRWMPGYHGSASEKVRIVEEASNSLTRMKNRQLQDLYILELSRQIDVEVGWIRKALQSPAPNAKSLAPALQRESSERPESGAPDSGLSAEASEAEPASEVIKVKDAPRDEAFLLSLLLHRENLMRDLLEAGPEEVLSLLVHDGVRKTLSLAIDDYQRNPAAFSTLVARISSRVDDSSILMKSISILETSELSEERSEELERRLMGDYLNAIRQRFLKSQARMLAKQFKDQSSTEKLEEFMSIQRDRLALSKDTQ